MFSFIAWAVAGAATEDPARFLGLFGSKIEAAVVALLLAIAGVFGAIAVYIRRRARIVGMPDRIHQQRRADDKWRTDMKADLDRELAKFKAQFDTVEGLTRNNTARIEDVAELASTAAEKAANLEDKVDSVSSDVAKVEGYLHKASHDLRGEMQAMTSAMYKEMQNLSQTVSREMREMSQTVGDVTGSLRTLISTLRKD